MYFRKSYYYFDENDYQYNHYNNRAEIIDKEKSLPFNSKNISTKKLYDYIYKTNDPRKEKLRNIITFFIAMNFAFFFISYKFKKYSKHNLESVIKLTNENDI